MLGGYRRQGSIGMFASEVAPVPTAPKCLRVPGVESIHEGNAVCHPGVVVRGNRGIIFDRGLDRLAVAYSGELRRSDETERFAGVERDGSRTSELPIHGERVREPVGLDD